MTTREPLDVFQGGEHSPKSVLYVSIMLKTKETVKKSTRGGAA